MKITCVGLGYVGLPTAALLAENGADVYGYDINESHVKLLKEGKLDFAEKSLGELVNKVISEDRLTLGTSPIKSDVFIIAVPTPLTEEHKPDLSYVCSAIKAISPLLEPGNLIILESTSPVGTTNKIHDVVSEYRPDLLDEENNSKLLFAFCPERVLPGNTLHELKNNDRLIGALSEEARLKAKEVFEIYCEGAFFFSDAKHAEMAKLVENSFRDLNIAFANELALICDNYDLDVRKVIKMANKHPRVNILSPGVGVGGHCLPLDPWFLAADNLEDTKLIQQARLVNDATPGRIAKKTKRILEEKGLKQVLVLGLAYKPNVGDFRESPSIELLKELLLIPQCEVLAHDPYIEEGLVLPEAVKQIGFDEISSLMADTLIIVATPHELYKKVNFSESVAHLDPSLFLVDPLL